MLPMVPRLSTPFKPTAITGGGWRPVRLFRVLAIAAITLLFSAAIDLNSTVLAAPARSSPSRETGTSIPPKKYTLQQSLLVGEPDFGQSVALSQDGTTAAVGSGDGDPFTSGLQALYIFSSSSGGWSQQFKFTPPGDDSKLYGHNTVALSGDGKTAAFGAVDVHMFGTYPADPTQAAAIDNSLRAPVYILA